MGSKICSEINWKFRHIRYVDSFGIFKKARQKFRTKQLVLKFLKQKKYLDAYYSVAEFANPHKIGPRLEEKQYIERFLKMDLFFDIDFDEFSFKKNITLAMNETKKLLKIGKQKGWEIKYIAFSGSKGFHVCYKDPWKYKKEKPFERENEATKKREKLVKLLKPKIKFDYKITSDSRRIVRIPGTFNSKSGYKCSVISQDLLDLPVEKFLSKIEYSIYWKVRSWFLPAMKVLRYCSIIIKRRFLPKPSSYSYLMGVKSNYKKSHVICLEVNRVKNTKELFEEMKIPYVIFLTPKGKFVFSPIIVPKEQLENIAKKLDSKSLKLIRKYKHTVVPVQFLNKDMKPIKGIKTIVKNECQTKLNISKTHAKLFEMDLDGHKIDLNITILENIDN
jgi:hypothetical protein